MAITQMDGAYDYDINMEGVLEGAPTANGVEIPEEQTTGNPERGAALIREPEQEITIARDVEMEDAEFAEPERDKISPVYGYQPFRCAATGEADMNSPETLERESTPLEPTTEQVIQAFSPESQQRDQALAEDGVVEMKSPDMPTSARSTAAVDGESLMFAPEVLMGNSAIHESGPEFDMEHLRESIDTGIVMAMPESAQKLQDEPVLSVELDAAHALQNTLFTTPAPFSSLRKSAISYLAWLQQRQKRFPTAHPHYPECIAIGKRLSRSPHYVYEDVLYHWGLETDSVYGAWHRQHRLQVLGEDPCPDEETVGLWAAWK
ncbi:hypothetical protein EJ02DRAFT_458773 [Clathrospora elynae]|uniref:Uncharacterized protein n=1 Tax=Clathrospora elynae TaxID=706981 RepID=A0A6A5SJ44_9PLEO|nr:hypothetical protein EJ02DRAFT_458773 [Clathrospora elynae]